MGFLFFCSQKPGGNKFCLDNGAQGLPKRAKSARWRTAQQSMCQCMCLGACTAAFLIRLRTLSLARRRGFTPKFVDDSVDEEEIVYTVPDKIVFKVLACERANGVGASRAACEFV